MMKLFLTMSLAAISTQAAPTAYEPLAVPKAKIESFTTELRDDKRQRVLPLRVYLPAGGQPAPVILFSHGLGGSCDNNPYLGNHWAGRGYVVVFVQHAGSDESVWKDTPAGKRLVEMKQAASAEAFLDRAKDVPGVIDALTIWNKTKGHALMGRLDLDRIGMSGHSFGAVTTQALAGQEFGGGRINYHEKRIDAALMMSPSPPKHGEPREAFGAITIPCLLMTGTEDSGMIVNTTPEDRLKVYPSLSKAPAWQVVFHEAKHMDFGERKLQRLKARPDRYHHAILALSTAFWDAHLRGDPQALKWLNGEGAKQALIALDLWQRNANTR